MAVSASFHGVVGLQNGSHYQIDRKNFWRYDRFIATPELGDIRVNVFTFSANTASVEDGIYLLDVRTTIGSIVDDEGKSAHSLHLFANDELQPMPDGARAFLMVIIAGKVSRGAFQLKQDNGFDMDVFQYIAGPQQNIKHVVVQGTIQKIMGDRCVVTVKDIALGPSDMVTATDDSSEGVPSTTLSQFDWGGAHKEKEQGTLKGKAKEKGKKEDGEESDAKNDSKRAHNDDDKKDRDNGPSTSAALPHKATRVSK
ncbi:hypothetical protein C8R48DRAFT_775554 [Suillus tomentosus]|nr:hypothetical protein C8R48DRAFT_775554 [Suillus tomentosus]